MIEAMKQALDALEKVKRRAVVMGSTGDYREGQLDALKAVSEDVKPAIASLQQAIKDLESQEPVAWIAPRYEGGHENLEVVDEREFGAFRVYTAPPQRTWQGLTDDEIDKGLLRSNYALQTAGAWRDGVEWATKQLKEKNHG